VADAVVLGNGGVIATAAEAGRDVILVDDADGDEGMRGETRRLLVSEVPAGESQLVAGSQFPVKHHAARHSVCDINQPLKLDAMRTCR